MRYSEDAELLDLIPRTFVCLDSASRGGRRLKLWPTRIGSVRNIILVDPLVRSGGAMGLVMRRGGIASPSLDIAPCGNGAEDVTSRTHAHVCGISFEQIFDKDSDVPGIMPDWSQLLQHAGM
jgi:hypothetical protein